MRASERWALRSGLRGPGVFSADCAIGVVDSGMGDLRDYVLGCWRDCGLRVCGQ